MVRRVGMLGLGIVLAGAATWAAPDSAQDPAGSLALPVERSQHVFFARGTINGRGPFWFTVDTGATLTVLDPATATHVGLATRDAGARADVGVGPGVTDLATAGGADLRFGDAAPFRPAPLYVLPVKAAEAHLRHRIDGVVGTDFLRQFVVEFDYATGRVALHQPGSAPGRAALAGVPVRLADNVLTATAILTLPDGRTLTPRLLVDTGSSGGLSLNTPFVRAHELDDVFPIRPGRALNLRVSVGVNGATTSRVVSFASFGLGGATLATPDVALSSATDGLSASVAFDGILGADVLRRFHLVIDYPGRRLLLRSADPE